MRWIVLSVVVAQSAMAAGSLESWVKERVSAQKKGLRPEVAGDAELASTLSRKPTSPIPGFVPPSSLAPLVKQVRPGVVNIAARNEGTSRSVGSGFVISADGLVVTNNHVVERAQSVEVRLADGRSFSAALVGRDPSTDLALLRLEGAQGLPAVTLGDSDQLEVGDWVVAIGNPFGLETSVTLGIISARERIIGVGPFDDFIQTNAPINPGNSGGPLFDMRGEVVGVTTAVMAHGQGIGFAVPIDLVKELLPNLLKNGRPERGWLGINVQELVAESGRGSMVVDVFRDSPAEKAGVKPGDRVAFVGGKAVTRYQQLLRRIALLAPGSTVKLGLVRDGTPMEIEVTLERRPALELLRARSSGGRVDALGLAVRELDAAVLRQLSLTSGLRVDSVAPGSAADLAGLAVGDIISEVNRAPVSSLKGLSTALGLAQPGEPTLVKIHRGDVSRYVALRVR